MGRNPLPVELERREKLLSIEDFPEFRKEDEYGVWITEFTLNYAEHYLSCRLRREITEYASDFNPQARPPVFGKLVIRDGHGGKDDILQGYQMNVSPEGPIPLLCRGDESDIYKGEAREILLDILDRSLKNIPENSRRYHNCQGYTG